MRHILQLGSGGDCLLVVANRFVRLTKVVAKKGKASCRTIESALIGGSGRFQHGVRFQQIRLGRVAITIEIE